MTYKSYWKRENVFNKFVLWLWFYFACSWYVFEYVVPTYSKTFDCINDSNKINFLYYLLAVFIPIAVLCMYYFWTKYFIWFMIVG